MKTTTVTFEDLAGSVIAVPPLARHADLLPNQEANAALIRHLEAGGVTTLLYGGNANFYNIGVGGYAALMESLIVAVADDTWLIPSVGPDFGKLMDQAPVVRDFDFPTVMILPLPFPATPDGSESGIRAFAETYGKPVIIYIKFEGYLDPEGVKRLVDDGLVCGIKYAIVRDDPGNDDYLRRLTDLIDSHYIISGIGERPAITHLREFGLNGFTSGSVCIAPASSTRILQALKEGDDSIAENIRTHFMAFEDLRDSISPIRVLHDGVTLSGIADMGPMLPLLSGLQNEDSERVGAAAKALLAYDREQVPLKKSD